ncbi:MAG: carboxymuconolactone decarboxylase family protein [Alphaproteobacteria bacterium]|nr:carboxymuconolactone decarboxylase family protein [Alphaproteobacteria bacterium]
MRGPMSRLPDLDPAQLDPEQRRVYDAIVAGPRGAVVGPLRAWLTSPGLADHAQALGAYCRFATSLPPRLSELALLVVGAHWRADFEWHVHHPIGVAAGLDPEALDAIRRGRAPRLGDPDEAAVYAFARELLTEHRVAPATYREATARLGEKGVVDLVGILGYYGLVCMTLVAFEIPLPDGAAKPFPDDNIEEPS